MAYSGRNRQRGMTLPELMLGVAVVGCTLVLGLPALGDSVARTRLEAAATAMSASLAQARLAAISTGHRSVLCPSRSGDWCDPGSRWESGWIAFVDADRDGVPDPGEQRLLRQDAAGAGIAVTTTAGRPRILFHPDGRSGSANATIRICAEGRAQGRALVLNSSGRVRSDRQLRCS